MATVPNLIREATANWKPLAIALFMLAGPGSTNAAWEDVGLVGGDITDFALYPGASNTTTISATAELGNQGVWRSENGGDTWAQQLAGSDYRGTAIQTANTDVVLAGLVGGAVNRTSNAGVGWLFTLSGSYDSWVFSFAPNSPGTVYAGGATGFSGVFLSSIGGAGATWNANAVGIDANPAILAIAVDPFDSTTVYAAVMSAVGGFEDGLYKSVDSGATWTLLSGLEFSQINGLTIDPNDNARIYATSLVEGGSIRRSANGGTDWVGIHNSVGVGGVTGFSIGNSIAVNPAESTIIYAVGGSGASRVILSTDCGVSWTDADPTDEMAAGEATRVEIDRNNNFVYVLIEGVLYRDDLESTSTGSCAASDVAASIGGSDDSSELDTPRIDIPGFSLSNHHPGSGSIFPLLFVFGLLVIFKKRND